ncbi:1131_t:CDS:2 [Acaulospora morrowiae]|uniref:1131_t:CDS:1 n=1 Tax=Acaulospora morrowiae TaxID=94023 RepID=A0A9N8V954_9GLOM|nr:1131_t:CDS:2 [Acaulospora morrowiae]
MASIIDELYSSHQDVYDTLLNTLFPITFVILFNNSQDKMRESGENGQPISNEKSKEDEESILSKNSKENDGSEKMEYLDDLLYNSHLGNPIDSFFFLR